MAERQSQFKTFLMKLRKRHIIETLAAFIAGGWLFLEFVDRILIAHYELNKKWLDVSFVTLFGALLCIVLWRWFSGTEKRPGNVKVEVLLVPLIILVALAIDLNLVLQMAGIPGKKLLIGIVAFLLGIAWVIFKLSQWAAGMPEVGKKGVAVSSTALARPEKSIIVLPFVNISPEEGQDYFCDGMTEEIISDISHIHDLLVISRSSAMTFKGKKKTIPEIARAVNVRYVLEGSVRKAGNDLRIAAQLIDATTDAHVWAEKYTGTLDDVFDIQDRVSRAIVERLRLRLAGDRPLVNRYTENLAAYDLCLKARYHLLKMTPEGREAGRRYCEQAIVLDPNYALAHVILAESYFWSAFWGSMDPRKAFSRAKSAALEALRLDDTIADAHSALGTVLGSGEFDWPGAEREFRRALELNPSSTAGRYDYAWCYAMWFLLPLGRVEQATSEMRRALELDPLDPFYNSLLGNLLYTMGQFEPAIAQLQHAIDLDPTFSFSYWFLSITYRQMGHFDKAIAAAEKANQFSEGNALTLGTLGGLYGRAGRTAEARQLLEELTARRRSTYVPASSLASVYSGLGEQRESLEWIERGIEERDPIVVTPLKCSPSYDRVRSHPGFPVLLRKMNLEL